MANRRPAHASGYGCMRRSRRRRQGRHRRRRVSHHGAVRSAWPNQRLDERQRRPAMSRLQWLAILLLACELAGGAYWWVQKRAARPPAAAWESIDPLAADQIRALRTACRSAADWRRLGECYMAYGFFLEAEACHRQAVTQAPNDEEFVYQWAFALERLGLLGEADAQYEKAVQLGHPHTHECWYLIGRNRLRAEQSELAEAAFLKAGNLGAARYERARLAARDGRAREAVALTDTLVDEFPTTAQPNLL